MFSKRPKNPFLLPELLRFFELWFRSDPARALCMPAALAPRAPRCRTRWPTRSHTEIVASIPELNARKSLSMPSLKVTPFSGIRDVPSSALCIFAPNRMPCALWPESAPPRRFCAVAMRTGKIRPPVTVCQWSRDILLENRHAREALRGFPPTLHLRRRPVLDFRNRMKLCHLLLLSP